MSNNLNLFCGINSLGIPYTRDNTNHIGYFDIVASHYASKGYNVGKVNLCNIAKNRTFDLEEIFKNNTKYCDVRRNQYMCLKLVQQKNKAVGSLIPEEFPEMYLTKDVLDDANVTDLYVNSVNPVFMYSAGQNDFMTYIGTGPMELVDREVRAKLPSNLMELIIKSVAAVEKNWQFLISLNPSVKIYAYNMFYAPLFDTIQQEIFRQNKELNPNLMYVNKIKLLIDLFNSELAKRSKQYENVELIDVSVIGNYMSPGDFHPTYEGNQILAQMTIKTIDEKLIGNENVR